MTAAILVAFIASHSTAHAPSSGPPAGAVIMCVLLVNDRPSGEVLAAFGEKDVWVQSAGLTRAGLQWTGVLDKIVDGEALVSLSSVRPAITFEFDERTVTLRISAPPIAFGSHAIQMGSSPLEPVLRPRNNSFFMNYATTVAGGARPSFAGEIGLRAGGALLRSTLSRDVDGTLTRGATTIVVDDERRLVRWEAGDAFVSSSAARRSRPDRSSCAISASRRAQEPRASSSAISSAARRRSPARSIEHPTSCAAGFMSSVTAWARRGLMRQPSYSNTVEWQASPSTGSASLTRSRLEPVRRRRRI
jgi:hypothetical protein